MLPRPIARMSKWRPLAGKQRGIQGLPQGLACGQVLLVVKQSHSGRSPRKASHLDDVPIQPLPYAHCTQPLCEARLQQFCATKAKAPVSASPSSSLRIHKLMQGLRAKVHHPDGAWLSRPLVPERQLLGPFPGATNPVRHTIFAFILQHCVEKAATATTVRRYLRATTWYLCSVSSSSFLRHTLPNAYYELGCAFPKHSHA